MGENEIYTAEFLYAALNDMTEIISAFVMIGSKQGQYTYRKGLLKQPGRYGLFRIRE